MHYLQTIYGKVKQSLRKHTKEYFDTSGNTRCYANKPKMSDLEIIAFNIRRNYAKRFAGFYTRNINKVAAKTFKQLINLQNQKPINQTNMLWQLNNSTHID